MKGVIVAFESPTCTQGKHGNVIDYSIVGHRIQGSFGSPTVLLNSQLKPHRLVEVVAKGGWQTTTAVYAKTPKKFPESRIIGPFPPPQDWDPVTSLIEESEEQDGRRNYKKERLQEAWVAWCNTAEKELVTHFDLDEEGEKYQGRAEGQRFRTLPVQGWQVARKEGATSAYGARMGVVANRLGEVSRLVWSCRRAQNEEGIERKRNHIRIMCGHLGKYIDRACRNGHLHCGWEQRGTLCREWGWSWDVENQIEPLLTARWVAEARVVAEEEEERAKYRRAISWSQWAKRACEGGGSKRASVDKRAKGMEHNNGTSWGTGGVIFPDERSPRLCRRLARHMGSRRSSCGSCPVMGS